METQRKIILMTRHGVKKGNDIVPESLGRLYAVTGASLKSLIQNYGISPERAFLRHSDQPRTKKTGMAILAGAYQVPTEFTNEALDKLVIPGLTDIAESEGLCYGKDFKFSAKACSTPEGEAQYMRDWIAGPSAVTHQGEAITPFNDILAQARHSLVDATKNALTYRDLGVLSTHAGLIEALMLSAVYTSRENPIKTLDEIGGPVPMEGYANLVIDQNQKSGSYTAMLSRSLGGGISLEYPADITKLLSA